MPPRYSEDFLNDNIAALRDFGFTSSFVKVESMQEAAPNTALRNQPRDIGSIILSVALLAQLLDFVLNLFAVFNVGTQLDVLLQSFNRLCVLALL